MMSPDQKAAEWAAARLLTGKDLTWDRYRNRLLDGEPCPSSVGLVIAMATGLLLERVEAREMQNGFRKLLLEQFGRNAKKIAGVVDAHWPTLVVDYRDALARYAPPEACSTANVGEDLR